MRCTRFLPSSIARVGSGRCGGWEDPGRVAPGLPARGVLEPLGEDGDDDGQDQGAHDRSTPTAGFHGRALQKDECRLHLLERMNRLSEHRSANSQVEPSHIDGWAHAHQSHCASGLRFVFAFSFREHAELSELAAILGIRALYLLGLGEENVLVEQSARLMLVRLARRVHAAN